MTWEICATLGKFDPDNLGELAYMFVMLYMILDKLCFLKGHYAWFEAS